MLAREYKLLSDLVMTGGQYRYVALIGYTCVLLAAVTFVYQERMGEAVVDYSHASNVSWTAFEQHCAHMSTGRHANQLNEQYECAELKGV